MDENSLLCVDKMFEACMSFFKKCTDFEHISAWCNDDIRTKTAQWIDRIERFASHFSTVFAMPNGMFWIYRDRGEFFCVDWQPRVALKAGLTASSCWFVRQAGA